MTQSLLVTGGAGFIGVNFVHYWLETHPSDQVVVLDALTYAGNLASLSSVISNSQLVFVKGDICDGEHVKALLREYKITALINFAAESHVDRSIADAGAFIQTNIVGTYTLLNAAKQVWQEEGTLSSNRFHHISTEEVFGSLNDNENAFTEEHAFAPNSPYSASKASADHLVRAYHKTYGLNTTISHCSNNFGPYQFPEKLIPLTVIRLLENKPVPLYGDGSNIRDWLYVRDHCQAIDLVLKQGKAGERYNFGGNNEWSNLALVEWICVLLEKLFDEYPAFKQKFPEALAVSNKTSGSLIHYVADRPGHDWRYAVDIRKSQRELGFTARADFHACLKDTLLWYLQHDNWWTSIRDGSYREWFDQQYNHLLK